MLFGALAQQTCTARLQCLRDRIALGNTRRGHDATTGAQLWRWYAIPSPNEGGWWGQWTPVATTGESLGRDIAHTAAGMTPWSQFQRIRYRGNHFQGICLPCMTK